MSNDITEVFRTHASYIGAFSFLATDGPATRAQAYERLITRIEAAGSLSPTVNASADRVAVRRILENAWGTESLMVLGEAVIDGDELVRLSNNWSAVQCYYTGYHSVQALIVARGFARPTQHAQTQKMFADLWTQPRLNLAPWTLAADNTGIRNTPTGVTIDSSLHPWSNCNSTTCWSIASKALETTRRDYLAQARAKRRDLKQNAKRREWKEEEKRRLASGKRPRREPDFPLPLLSLSEKADVNRVTRPATILDYLYRVRVKTNYEDSAVFTDGPDDDSISEMVRSDFCVIAGTTLLLHEAHIAALVGRSQLFAWADEWVSSKLPAGLTVGLAERLDILGELCRCDR